MGVHAQKFLVEVCCFLVKMLCLRGGQVAGEQQRLRVLLQQRRSSHHHVDDTWTVRRKARKLVRCGAMIINTGGYVNYGDCDVVTVLVCFAVLRKYGVAIVSSTQQQPCCIASQFVEDIGTML